MKAYFVPIYILMGSTELESAVSEIKKDAIWKKEKIFKEGTCLLCILQKLIYLIFRLVRSHICFDTVSE